MNNSYQWHVFGSTVRGAAHVRADRPNQDFIRWSKPSEAGQPLTLAVADGHGSAICFRSNEGSRLAVETANRLLQELKGDISASAINHFAQEHFPQRLIRDWIKSVDEHLDANPCSEEETQHLQEPVDCSGDNKYLVYGATLLGVAVTDSCILYVQLGDGDIVVVDEEGEAQRAIPKDDKLIGNETTSLCGPDAWHEVRVVVQRIEEHPPAMILVSTDGYANSFRDDEGFLKVGPDLLEMVRENGLDYVKQELDNWLTEASHSGSGDDVTLGIIHRLTT